MTPTPDAQAPADLVERLLDHGHLTQRQGLGALLATGREAADRIAALEGEVAEARERSAASIDDELAAEKRAQAAEARVAEMEGALRPFAETWLQTRLPIYHEGEIHWTNSRDRLAGNESPLQVGDFERAARALTGGG